MSLEVSWPKEPLKPEIEYQSPKELNYEMFEGSVIPEVPIPVVAIDGTKVFLLKDLARLFSYPSPQQLIKTLARGTQTPKKEFVKFTGKELNDQLLKEGLITADEAKFKLSYVDALWIGKFLQQDLINANISNSLDEETGNGGIVVDDEENAFIHQQQLQKRKASSSNEDDFTITISQAFPQYGFVDSSIEFTHAAFSTLTNVTKYNYYMSVGGMQKYLPQTKMTPAELDQYMKESDFADVEVPRENSESPQVQKTAIDNKRKQRKHFNRQKKYNTNIDPNLVDLTDLLIPGQGFIPEFNINHLCKIPNYYYTTSASVNQSSNGSTPPIKKVSLSLFGSLAAIVEPAPVKLSKNLQQLVAASESSDPTSLGRYYYTMGYRGPGSGNYKDAALINKISKIPIASTERIKKKTPHFTLQKLNKLAKRKRYLNSVRGFVSNGFSKQTINTTLNKHRDQLEDFENMEMLHNSLQFNVLLNTYREIAGDTWKNYYKFKEIDFEQLGMLQKDRARELQKHYEFEEKRRALFAEKDDLIKKQEEDKEKEELKKREEEEKEKVDSEGTSKEQESEKNSDVKDENATEKSEGGEIDTDQDKKIDSNDNEDASKEDEFAMDVDEPKSRTIEEIENEIAELVPPTPQPRLKDRFEIPTHVPEVIRHLPLHLRDDISNTISFLPLVQDVSDHITSYAELPNAPSKTQVEVVRVPNANSLGWDNIKKFRN